MVTKRLVGQAPERFDDHLLFVGVTTGGNLAFDEGLGFGWEHNLHRSLDSGSRSGSISIRVPGRLQYIRPRS